MSTFTTRLAAGIKANPLIAGSLVVGVVGLVSIAAVLAWSNPNPAAISTNQKHTATSQNKGKTDSTKKDQETPVTPTQNNTGDTAYTDVSPASDSATVQSTGNSSQVQVASVTPQTPATPETPVTPPTAPTDPVVTPPTDPVVVPPTDPVVTPPVVTPADPTLCNAAGTVATLATVAPTATTFDKARVSLTFDDGWRSIYGGTTGTNGAYFQLKDCGLVSTQYLNSTPILGAYEDYMTYDMVKAFKASGNELAWHTQDHADLTTLDQAGIDLQLTIPQDFLTNTGTTVSDFKNFATPYGAYNTDTTANPGVVPVVAVDGTVQTEIAKYYGSHRSTDVGYNTKANFNTNNIVVQNMLDSTTPAEVEGWVQQAVATNSWLVIVYHEVKVDADAATEDYSVTPENLAIELSYIKQSGITVQTVDQALTELKTQL